MTIHKIYHFYKPEPRTYVVKSPQGFLKLFRHLQTNGEFEDLRKETLNDNNTLKFRTKCLDVYVHYHNVLEALRQFSEANQIVEVQNFLTDYVKLYEAVYWAAELEFVEFE